MTIAQVQKVAASSTGGSATVTVTIAAATAGNLLIACFSNLNTSVTCTPPTGFTEAVTTTSTVRVRIFYKVAAGGETALTFTLSASQHKRVLMLEYSGLSATPLDTIASSADAGSAVSELLSGTTANTAQNDELVIAAFATSYAPNSFGTLDNGFTKESEGNSGSSGVLQCVGSRIGHIYGKYSTKAPITTAARACSAIATFKGATTSAKTGAPAYVSGARWLGPYRTKVWSGSTWR